MWLASVAVISVSNLLSPEFDPLTLAAALTGVTSLILAAKGNVWAQILMVLFSVLYGVISFRFRYYGEMMTYLAMTLPMSVWSAVTWFRHPSSENRSEVTIQPLKLCQLPWLAAACAVVTALFYLLLRSLHTPNLFFSTVSVFTSFLAVSLTMLRSSYYALGYAANDAVLIILWGLASFQEPVYFPVVINFAIFLLNDLYGFFRWKKREVLQRPAY